MDRNWRKRQNFELLHKINRKFFKKNELNVVYLGKENDIIDINYNMEAYGKKTEEVINVQGAITDNVKKKNFKGTIDFKEGATKSVGKEKRELYATISKCKVKVTSNATLP